jgi:hypothetical protein
MNVNSDLTHRAASPGVDVAVAGLSLTISASSRTSRAAARPDAGTMTSRGPAASMSGTSNPAERRTVDGMPSSSRRPWTNSASAWFIAPATRTSSPSAYLGSILPAVRSPLASSDMARLSLFDE